MSSEDSTSPSLDITVQHEEFDQDDEIEPDQIEKKITEFIEQFNEWNSNETKEEKQLDEYVKKMKKLIDITKKVQIENGSCPINSETLTNLLKTFLLMI